MTAKLLAIGECMMELTAEPNERFKKGYAGDTYNALVYAKRLNPKLTTCLLTALGDDQVSQDMQNSWLNLGVSNSQVITTNQATIGLYSIATDETGERSFSYWRKGSAASQMMQLLSFDELVNRNTGFDTVFFSGISLAILTDEDKATLISLIAQLKKLGASIAFDPNYRSKMWKDEQHAINWLTKAYEVSDILMPGIEEHQQLFGHQTSEQIMDFCQQFSAREVIIKCGNEGVFGYESGQFVYHQPFAPAPIQVDSTAAGDSFAGTYLAARLSGDSVENSIKKACFVAGQVVQHKGAILSETVYQKIADEVAKF